ncbi:hypothetical protein A2531_06485 [Candidatus Falkowbacteria bacterium RIFOXYD2_FULL_34_120]|uniref:DUF3147 family protein n=1 Tax=Candidatus Falkowbacteria bacterium RIFOXYD2_FULL_34_120 TaxID=1798007 RepID=A0A1F5TMW1_9BACT|nr:MAG: hypothetical protein A2500_05115 [Candidatus Falkowbacteria bacterium RIFOXYC12_FULL_34_55]OGF38014.1 MAG: hypothetical protein A2466_03825 [Candidatus Falkowbacteria bacterium RIFOXYC2_FULL_34_220]OGF38269.1 MAG: hypothetical protein A2515_00735 [Candidatus Falkowbacteria bacterium RIFOXYD12_FULL_34_57]OGF40164.1 MAG: hypothetical protein A2531_06485 [Candidatus Falkowbacteria bacterium RIFOXYD2_FULL_34_120]
MLFYVAKIVISALLILLISEVSKKYTVWGAVCASIPVVSVLSFIWIYIETRDAQKIINLSFSIFWLVIPSLIFFVALPFFLKMKINFSFSLLLAIAITSCFYFVTLKFL